MFSASKSKELTGLPSSVFETVSGSGWKLEHD